MKVAVSIPDSIFDAAERLAERRNVPRSQVFAEALEQYLKEHGGESIRQALDAIYSTEDSRLDSAVAEAQAKVLDDEAW